MNKHCVIAFAVVGILLLAGCVNQAKDHLDRGRKLWDQNMYAEAEKEFREAIRLKPGYAEAHNSLGNALGFKGKYDEAIKEYNEAIRLKPNLATAHYGLGTTFNAKHKYDEAIKEFHEAIRLDSTHAEAYYNLGHVFFVQGKTDEAMKVFQVAKRLKPDLPDYSQQRWTRTYGGKMSCGGGSVQQTSDGGYIIAGNTSGADDSLVYGDFMYDGSSYPEEGASGSDFYLIKTDSLGDTLWTRTYGGKLYDESGCVQQTSDGGYIIAGYTNSFKAGGYYDVYLIKTNASGDTLWTRTYGGKKNDYGDCVQQTSDGGYIIGGTTNSFKDTLYGDVYLIKTNASGDTLWTKTYGGKGKDVGRSIEQTSDGGYIIAGLSNNYPEAGNVYLIKTNASGDTLWTRTYRGGTEPCEYGDCTVEGRSVQQTSDGGYIITGKTGSGGITNQEVLIKTNAQGDKIWTRAYGGTGKSTSGGNSVQQTADGGYVITGFTAPIGPDLTVEEMLKLIGKKQPTRQFVSLIKTNSSGNTLWTRMYDGTNGYEGVNFGSSVQQTSDGGYIIAGGTYSFVDSMQVYLIKTDANGNAGVGGKRHRGSRVKRKP